MKTAIYAIGDIHGRLDLLDNLHGLIEEHAAMHAADRRVLVYLGDYVDRGPDSKGVIEFVMKGRPGFETVALLGNHEEMMLKFVEGEPGELWLRNGGDEALRSFGVDPRVQPLSHAEAASKVGREILDWLRARPRSFEIGGFFFAHAGARPGISLKDQSEEDLIWIRGRFTNSDYEFGLRIVHGHSPIDEPAVRRNRIGIDTGAVWSGRLTAAVLDPDRAAEEPTFLMTQGRTLEELAPVKR